MKGWRRVRYGRGFAYFTHEGDRIRDPLQLDRIRKLAIPPAYTDVWICASENGHLQATGRDAKGRKQYRYHAGWVKLRAQAKFDRMLAFGRKLPSLRRAVGRDLSGGQPCLDAVVAAIVRLLDRTGLRVGNDEYAAEGSYGLSTLRNRHAATYENHLMLRFIGKSGVVQQADVSDRRVVSIVQQCHELPGQRLFQFVNEHGEIQHVRSDHINTYVQAHCGGDFTAKDFRTWHASVQAMKLVLAMKDAARRQADLVDTSQVVKQVAQQLGNTSSVCRKFYIHPAVLSLCAGEIASPPPATRRNRSSLGTNEQAFMDLLRYCQRSATTP